MRDRSKQNIFIAFRLLIGGIFLWAGIEKILAPFDFSISIYNYRLFPELFIGLAAAILPWVEAIAGLCLLTGFYTKGAASITSLMLLAFVSLIIISAVRGLDIDCGCFGGVERKVGIQAILEDVLLFIISAAVLLFETKPINALILFKKYYQRELRNED